MDLRSTWRSIIIVYLMKFSRPHFRGSESGVGPGICIYNERPSDSNKGGPRWHIKVN